jgi:hypothetical protein
MTVRCPHHCDLTLNTIESDNTIYPVAPYSRLTHELHAKLTKKCYYGFEIIDHDTDIVHSSYCHRFYIICEISDEQLQDEQGRIGLFQSSSPRCLNGGDVDFLHRHHRLEGTLCLVATSLHRLGEHAGCDLPG